MRLTKQQVLDLNTGLEDVSHLPGAKWAYVIARNIALLKPEMEALQKAYAADSEYIEYDNERVKVVELHAVKENGKPQKETKNGVEQYVIDNEEKFDKAISQLQKKYEAAISSRKKQVQEFEEILKEETEINLFLVDPVNLPEAITPAQLSVILPIIKEDTNTKPSLT